MGEICRERAAQRNRPGRQLRRGVDRGGCGSVVEVVAGGSCDPVSGRSAVGRITLNRPDRMNAITVALAPRSGARHPRASAAIPRSTSSSSRGSDGNFCAGGDFDEVQRLQAEGPDALRALFTAFRRACDAIAARRSCPVVVAVEGVAMAGGFELMQAADIVLVSDDARIADNHINFGMIPGGGSTQRLPRLVGRQTALGLLLSGDQLSGAEAVRLGLAYRSFPQVDSTTGVRPFVETWPPRPARRHHDQAAGVALRGALRRS